MSNRLLISDANIIIDMVAGQLIDEMFQLPNEFATATMLFFDELEEYYPELLEMGLILIDLEEEAIKRAEQLGIKYNGISSYDTEALALAEQQQVPLLTGDAKLRQVSLKEGVDVRGTLWLVEQLLIQDLITVEQAQTAYNKMEEEGSRLPWDKVKTQLKAYK